MLDLPNETRLLSSDDDRLLLTTHRVRFEAKSAAFRRVTSILLEEVSACEIASTSKPWLFTLALLFVLLGLLGLEGPHTNDAKLSFLIAFFLDWHTWPRDGKSSLCVRAAALSTCPHEEWGWKGPWILSTKLNWRNIATPVNSSTHAAAGREV